MYIHHGAYAVASFFFKECLTISDRRQLRLVSRKIEEVVTEYAILQTLHLSSHNEDLDAVEAFAKKPWLLRHVKQVIWDHSVYEATYTFGHGPQCFAIVSDDPHPLVLAAAEKQYRNLLEQRDFAAVRAILPHLTSVILVNLSASLKETQWPLAWHFLASPMVRRWIKEGPPMRACDLPVQPRQSVASLPYTITEFLGSNERDMWRTLPMRGVHFLATLAREKTKQEKNIAILGCEEPVGLATLLPSFSSFTLHVPPSVFQPNHADDAHVHAFINTTVRQTRGYLDISVVECGRGWNPADADALTATISCGTNLRRLHLCLSTGTQFQHISLLRFLSRIPPEKFPHLEILDLTSCYALFAEAAYILPAWCARVESCIALRLILFKLFDGTWERCLQIWRESGLLARLRKIQLEAVTDSEVGRMYFSSYPTAITAWLNGTLDQMPLIDASESGE